MTVFQVAKSNKGADNIRDNIFKKYYKDMTNYSKMTNSKYGILFIITMLFSIVNGASSYFSKVIIDLVNDKAPINLIIVICILIILAYLIISVFNIYKDYIQVKISNNLDYGIKSYYFDIVQKSTYLNNECKESSEIYYRMFHDIGLMSSYFIRLVIVLPVNVISIFLYVGIMIYWSYKLTIVAVIVSIIQIIVTNYNKPHVNKITAEVINNENRFVKEIGEHFRGIETVKTLGLEDFKLKKIKQIIETVKVSKHK